MSKSSIGRRLTAMILPFDAHNHVHMGPTAPSAALVGNCGMAIMSTHPRDYSRVLHLSQSLVSSSSPTNQIIVPCFGIHPWFLSELTQDDWELVKNVDGAESHKEMLVPRWVQELEEILIANPRSISGEFGLDNFHYDGETGNLKCPLDRQIESFELQFELAIRLQRPVSLHCVQAMGPMMDSMRKIKKKYKNKKTGCTGLPPKVYFHAFGGKEGAVDQLLALCDDKQSHQQQEEPPSASKNGTSSTNGSKVYFGFAPIINFRSPKTSSVIRKVGLDRLVLETDHEDAKYVQQSMKQGISYLAKALNVEEEIIIERTTANAMDLYGLS